MKFGKMKFAGCIVIALHLLALVAVSESMMIAAGSELEPGFSNADFRDARCKFNADDYECCVQSFNGTNVCASWKLSTQSSRYEVTVTSRNVAAKDVPGFVPIHVRSTGCSCSGKKCKCCVNIRNTDFCAGVEYVSENFAIRVSLTAGDHQLFVHEISIQNPPPICVRIPKLAYSSACVKFYGMINNNQQRQGCVALKLKLASAWTVYSGTIGCIGLPSRNDWPEFDVNELTELMKNTLDSSWPSV